MPGVGTVGDGEYTFDTDVEQYVNLSYVPTSPDGTVYEDTRWHDSEEELAEELPPAAPASGANSGSVDIPEKAGSAAEAQEPAGGENSGAVDIPEKAGSAAETGEVPAEAPAEASDSSNMVPIIVVVLVLLVVVIAVVIIVKKKKK